jgi:hypothetical protein
MPKRNQPEPHTQFTIRVPVAHVAALQEQATKEDRTVSAKIRLLIRRHLESSGEGLREAPLA